MYDVHKISARLGSLAMKKTTLDLKSLAARRRNTEDHPVAPLIQGHSLLEHFAAYAKSVPAKGLAISKSELYLRVTNVACRGSYVMVSVESGIFGDNGKVYDVETGAFKYDKSSKQSVTTATRVVMFLPPDADQAIFAVEKAGNSRGFTLFNSFIKAMRDHDHSFVYISANIYETDTWTELSKLTRVQLTAKEKRFSKIEGLDKDKVVVANLQQCILPPDKQKYLPDTVKQAILDRRLDATSLFSVSDDLDKEVKITLRSNDREKTFILGKQGTPLYREVLTDDGAPQLDDDSFIKKVAESVADKYHDMGKDWNQRYETDDWDEEKLNFSWNEKEEQPHEEA
jgi:hypothetical protein